MLSAGAITPPCIHACGSIRELRVAEQRVGEDYQNLLRTLTG